MKFNQLDKHNKVRGFIVIKDSSGNVIESVENMILLPGRKALLKNYFNIMDSEPIKKPGYLFLSESNNIAADISSTENGNTTQDLKNAKYISLEGAQRNPHFIGNECYIEYLIEIDFNSDLLLTGESYEVNSLGLCFEAPDATYKNLFSRAVINPKTFVQGQRYTIQYYLYF